MNEPEWVISNIPQPAVNGEANPVTMQQFWSLASQFSNAVHSRTNSYVTVGSAALKWNKIWMNAFADKKGLPRLNLDFYQTHYYPWMDCCTTNNDPDLGTTTWSPLTQNASSLALDKPIVVGEIPDTSASRDKVLTNNYAGYWPWSYKWNNTGDKIQIDWSTYTPWEVAHASIVRITNSITPKTGDLDSDGDVDIFDLSSLITRWGSSDANADLNDNGKVDIYDLSILLTNWGT
jgi:hypothetical protein